MTDETAPRRGSPALSPSEPAGASRLRQELRAAVQGLDAPGAIACVVAMSMLVVAHHHGDTSSFRTHFGAGLEGLQAELFPYLYWLLASFALYGPAPALAAALTPGLRARDTGMGLGDWRLGLKATAALLGLFLPVVFLASRLPAFAGHYPLCGAVRSSAAAFVAYEVAFALYFIGWEYLFRGYLLFSLERSIGKMAVFAQTMPFVVIHYGKPELEVFGSIVAGLALGLLALRTRSFWYGALLHVGVALSLDLFVTLLPAAR